MNADLPQRVRTAAILIGGLLAIGLASLKFCFFRWVLFDSALAATVCAAYEYIAFSQPHTSRLQRVPQLLITVLPAILVFYGVSVLGLCERSGAVTPVFELSVLGFCVSVIAAGLAHLRARDATVSEITQNFGEKVIALVYLGFFSSFLLMLACEPSAFLLISWFITVVAVNDSAAYFGGRRFGRHLFAPVISPKKTIEGSVIGLVAGVMIGSGLAPVLLPNGNFTWGAVLAALVVCAAQLGDLVKSALKRLHNTKDSGTILPGHGGVLDRIDGLIGAAPVFFLLRDWFSG